jgi:hypothetical protein
VAAAARSSIEEKVWLGQPPQLRLRHPSGGCRWTSRGSAAGAIVTDPARNAIIFQGSAEELRLRP